MARHRDERVMPFRFFVPLPGPFYWQPRSRAERAQRREDRAERLAGASPEGMWWRGLVLALVVWAVLISAATQAGPVWTVVAVLLAFANIAKGIDRERARRQAEVE